MFFEMSMDSSDDEVFGSQGAAKQRSGARDPRGRAAETSQGTAVVTMVGEVDLRSLDAHAVWRLHVVGVSTSSFVVDDGEHIIGRSSECGIRVDEDSISRKHALLTVDGDSITITDLGSMNGSRVRERSLKANQPANLAPGESFELGTVMLVMQRKKQRAEPSRRIYDHGYFENRVDEEIARRAASRTMSEDSGATVRVMVGSGITICRLHLDAAKDILDDVALGEVLEATLPPSAICAEYAPGELELMFIDEPWEAVENACEALREDLTGQGIRCRTGFAIFPRDGRTASSLLSAANSKLSSEQEELVQPLGEGSPSPDAATAMDRLRRLVERVADSDISIVIHGETGVGKEVMAKEIHRLSPRHDKPFVGLNCAALTETLLESELFGHERGAFSGAVATKPGLFEVADKGTVFLDEIGEMSPAIQAKLLRVLEERTVLRVGGLHPRTIDVRFLAASHRDLEEEVTEGRLRQDLYFRLNGITVEIPPLRERTSEIATLANAFIKEACRRNKRDVVPTLGRDALMLFERYAWPGNIRELRNIVERAVLLSTDGKITAEHLPADRLQRHRAHQPLPRTPSPAQLSSPAVARSDGSHRPRGLSRPIDDGRYQSFDEDSDVRTRPSMRRASRPNTGFDEDTQGTEPITSRPPSENLKDAVSDLERQRIMDALRSCGGNQTKAAEMLGISRRTLVNRLDQYNLPRPRKGS